MCSDGRAAVVEMWRAFNYLSEIYPDFHSGAFRPSCEAIQAALDANDSWYADWIPFNPTCCTIAGIGEQAEVLTTQMLASVGAATLPAPPKGTDWASLVVIGGLLAIALVYSPQIKAALWARR